MSFYQRLSQYYDEIFAPGPAEMNFIKTLLNGSRRLLDLGCGTGLITAGLSASAARVIGVDQSESMISRARAVHARPNVSYEVMNMLEAPRRFPASSFDGLLCLGNTLVHLTPPAAIASFLADLAPLLAPGGRMVIQILNYDHLRANRIRELPPIETSRVVFRRYYDWGPGGALKFRTSLEVKESGPKLENEIDLSALGKAELEGMLKRAGFRNLESYGDYQGGPYREDAFALIVTARKS